jgi:hypothetical protein
MRQWRIAAIVYVFQFCLVFTLGMQVFGILEASIGHSLEINKLLRNYDHTVLTDFLKVHGASITPLIGQLRWLILAWLLFSVFIDAGLLVCAASPEESTGRAFWKGGAGYFFPFLKIGLFFLVLALIWTAAIWTPVALYVEPALQGLPSEKYAVGLLLCGLLIYLIGLAVLFAWSVVSRFVKIKTDASIAASLSRGFQIFRKNKWGFAGLLSGFAGLQLVLLVVYWQLEAFAGMTSPASILTFFVVQQAFVFFRIQIRQMLYAGVCALATRTGGQANA